MRYALPLVIGGGLAILAEANGLHGPAVGLAAATFFLYFVGMLD